MRPVLCFVFALFGLVAQAQTPLDTVTRSLSAPISLGDPSREYFDWLPMGYDFTGPWTGATDYETVRRGGAMPVVIGWSGQYRVASADLSYPVEVGSFFEPLGVFLIRVRCRAGPCIDMNGRRLGWDGGQSDPGALANPEAWEAFSITGSAIIFAVASCAEAQAIAAEMDLLLASQGAKRNPNVLREPCPELLQLTQAAAAP